MSPCAPLARFPFVKGLKSFDFAYQLSLDKKQIQQLCRAATSSSTARISLFSGHRGWARRIRRWGWGSSQQWLPGALDHGGDDRHAYPSTRRRVGWRKLKLYTVPRLLIIDEIGYLPMDRAGANLFFQLISRRYEKGPMILTSDRFDARAPIIRPVRRSENPPDAVFCGNAECHKALGEFRYVMGGPRCCNRRIEPADSGQSSSWYTLCALAEPTFF